MHACIGRRNRKIPPFSLNEINPDQHPYFSRRRRRRAGIYLFFATAQFSVISANGLQIQAQFLPSGGSPRACSKRAERKSYTQKWTRKEQRAIKENIHKAAAWFSYYPWNAARLQCESIFTLSPNWEVVCARVAALLCTALKKNNPIRMRLSAICMLCICSISLSTEN
jgi:hypothetical protein